ncbi:MAG: hypothetical protein AAFZ09_19325, partial [Pseudomonadota bacterium]
SLSRRTGLPVLSFNDVALADRATGRALMRVPRMSARFSMTALLVGRVEPVALVAVGPAARLVRLADGRVRFDLGGGEIPPDLPATEADATTAPTGGFQAINRLIDGLVGIEPPAPGTARLRRIVVRDADLTLRNRATGSGFSTRGASIRVVRREGGLEGTLDMPVIQADGQKGLVTLTARRAFASTETALDLGVSNIALARLGREIGELAFLAPVDAPLSGHLTATLGGDGALSALSAAFETGAGTLDLGEAVLPLDHLNASIGVGEDGRELVLHRVDIRSPVLEASLTGVVRATRDQTDGPATGIGRLEADLALSDLRLTL